MSNKKSRQKMIKKRQQKSKKAELDEIGRLMSQIESIPAARPRPTTGSKDKDSDILDSMIGAAKKTGGPLKYSVGGPIKPAWMRNS